VLHTRRGSRRYTALYSNTARAHRAGKTRDWVVIYSDDGVGENRHTVITATRGRLRGRRVVAGREKECAAFYERDQHAAATGRHEPLTPDKRHSSPEAST
jgi:putative hydrolase